MPQLPLPVYRVMLSRAQVGCRRRSVAHLRGAVGDPDRRARRDGGTSCPARASEPAQPVAPCGAPPRTQAGALPASASAVSASATMPCGCERASASTPHTGVIDARRAYLRLIREAAPKGRAPRFRGAPLGRRDSLYVMCARKSGLSATPARCTAWSPPAGPALRRRPRRTRPPRPRPRSRRRARRKPRRERPRSTSAWAETRSPWPPRPRAVAARARSHQQHSDDHRDHDRGRVEAEHEGRCEHDRGQRDLQRRVDGEGKSWRASFEINCTRRTRVLM